MPGTLLAVRLVIVGAIVRFRASSVPTTQVSVESNAMKKVEALIRHFKLEDVKESLAQAGIKGMTITEVRGFGRQKGHTEVYRGTEYTVDFVPKIKVEVAIADKDLPAVLEAITRAAKTGQVGDGKIFVSDLSEVVRIRTGESGDAAI